MKKLDKIIVVREVITQFFLGLWIVIAALFGIAWIYKMTKMNIVISITFTFFWLMGAISVILRYNKINVRLQKTKKFK